MVVAVVVAMVSALLLYWGTWNLTLQVTSVHQYQCTGKEIHTGTSRLAGVHSGRVSLLDTGTFPTVNIALIPFTHPEVSIADGE